MKTEDIERKMLLAETGELPADETAGLERRLAGDDGLRGVRAELRRVQQAARAALAEGAVAAAGPSPAVMARIRHEAVQRAAAPAAVLLFARPLPRALAFAAGLSIIAAGWLLLFAGKAHVARIDAVYAVLELTADTTASGLSAATTDGAASNEQREGEEKLRELANQLLLMEGLGATTCRIWIRHSRSFAPEIFDRVVAPRLGGQNVRDDVHEIQDHPPAIGYA